MFFDAHTHVHFAAFADDYRDAMARARAAGVRMILVGTQRDTSARAVEVAHEFPDLAWAAVGLHPVHTEASYHDEKELGGGDAAKAFTSRGESFDPEAYRALAADPKTVAIGECGLDYYRLADDTKERQKAALLAQMRLAEEVKKPLMIHCRNAFPDLIDLLRAERGHLLPDAGVIHFFTGTAEDARALLELGFSFTFGGVVTFPPKADQPSAGTYADVIRFIPADRIISETDAPYVAPAPYRGKRNEPAYVVETVKKLSELKGMDTAAMAAQIGANVARVFKVPEAL